jgi:hypothetical protein
MLIDPTKRKGIGRLYHLEGPISLGTRLHIVEEFDYERSTSHRVDRKMFSMPKSFCETFELIVRQPECPFHPSALTQTDPGPPACDDRKWVEEILRKTRIQLSNAGLLLGHDG